MESKNPRPGKFDLEKVNAYSSADALDAARQHVDGEIVRLEQSILSYKTRRNDFALTARLPPEVLSEIFDWYRALDVLESTYKWIEVTHVCRHWRNVALGCPRLWSYIVSETPRWTEELLARSKNAPLTFSATYGYPHEKSELSTNMALKHMHRMAALDLTMPMLSFNKASTHFDTPAPILESLQLAVVTHDPTGVDGCDLPIKFCRGIGPRLRSLSLRSCGAPWGLPFMNNLRVLKLASIPLETRPRVSDILGILRRASSLITLELGKDFIVGSPEGSGGHTDTVKLPHLTSIHVTSRLQECNMLIQQLSFPASAAITLACTCTKEAKVDISGLLPALKASSASGRGLQTLHITVPSGSTPSGGVEVRGWHATVLEPLATPQAPHFTFSLHWPNTESIPHPNKLLTTICKPLSLSRLQQFRVADIRGIKAETWKAIFRRCTQAQKVTLSDLAAPGFIKALDPSKPHAASVEKNVGATKKKPDVFLPALQELVLDWVSFEEGISEYLRIEDLRDCLSARAQRGAQLATLSVQDCLWFEDEYVDRLEEVVEEVEWDGVVNHGSDDESEEEFDSEYDSDVEYYF
ncbi:hypothetical protein PLICRDRAFT_163487 [Plicaturopsis crispa FD-325 SS-3]|nr:hypothetical protein PLICRDRAFT_163487 [Plicaturopsis crispa FD-325 SS-3]